MAKNLLIVESPAKTKTLARFLGKDFNILATIGHIIDLPKSKIGIDPENGFQPQYDVIAGKEKIIKELKKAAKTADKIFLAPDPDREGEAIAWHVANSLPKNRQKDIVRVTFNEITKPAVLDAIKNPRAIDINKVNAQQTRRILDRVVGYTVSPFLWKTIAYNLSAGRVQSVALRLVCEREVEIDKFISKEYWNITASLSKGKKDIFDARLFKIDDKTVVKAGEKGTKKLTIKSEKEVKKYLEEIKKSDFIVSEIKNTTKSRKPYAPFITSTLQQQGAQVCGFAPKKTMAIAQKLYEGIEIGKDGQTGLITYMRTDSFRVANEALKAVRGFIKKEYGDSYLPSKPIPYGRKKSAQDAHEAIRPTNMSFTPERMQKHLTPQQHKLYTIIWNRFVASQMNPAAFDVETIDIGVGRFTFRVSSQRVKFDGFLRVYNEASTQDNSNGEFAVASLPKMKEKDKLNLKKLTETQSFTKPPARFSEAMLIKQLEADGIGRPSTYASIISTIKDRKYTDLIEKRLHPTSLGKVVNKILVENFPKLFNVKFTANMEKELDLIETGEDDWIKVLKDFYDPFMKVMESLKGKHAEIKESLIEETDIECEKCGSKMIIKWGRNGRFMACSNYPECKNAGPIPGEEEEITTDKKCRKCNADMVVKTGRFGKFLACSAYPECKNTEPLTLGIKCPESGCDGEIAERKSKKGRLFYSCSNYPKCKFSMWDRPVDKKCTVCNYPFMVLKSLKSKGEFYRCPECKSQEPVKSDKVKNK